jgi:hypothetical protein
MTSGERIGAGMRGGERKGKEGGVLRRRRRKKNDAGKRYMLYIFFSVNCAPSRLLYQVIVAC